MRRWRGKRRDRRNRALPQELDEADHE
jgi:hypothetical protein